VVYFQVKHWKAVFPIKWELLFFKVVYLGYCTYIIYQGVSPARGGVRPSGGEKGSGGRGGNFGRPGLPGGGGVCPSPGVASL